MPNPTDVRTIHDFKCVSTMACLMMMVSTLSHTGCDAQVGPEFLGDPIASFRGVVSSANDTSHDEDSLEVAVVWLGCDDTKECRLELLGKKFQLGDVSENPEAIACVEDCSDLPECDSILDLDESTGMCEPYYTCLAECGLQAGLLNMFFGWWGNRFVSQEVEVQVQLPSQFTLDIYQEPVPEAIIGIDHKLALGVVVAKTPGGKIDFDSDSDLGSPLKGVAEKQVILYTKEPIEESSFLSRYLELGQSLETGFHVLNYEYRECPDIPFPDELNGTIVQCGYVVSVSSAGLDSVIEVTMGDISELQVPFTVKHSGPI